jgi:hypothetical protein
MPVLAKRYCSTTPILPTRRLSGARQLQAAISRESGSKAARRSKSDLRADAELMNVLHAAVESMRGENGLAPMTRIGQYISNHSSLIRATEYFEEPPSENNQPSFRSKKTKAA